MTQIIYITGTNAIGKTQWMLQNIGCQPDLKFTNRYDAKHYPIVGEMNEKFLFSDLSESYIQIFTRSLTKKERENLDETLVEVPSKIYFHFHFSTDYMVQIFKRLQQWNIEEVYISSITPITISKLLEYLTKPTDWVNKQKNSIEKIQIQLPQSLKYLFIERTNDNKFISIVDIRGNPTEFNPEVNTKTQIEMMINQYTQDIKKLESDIKKGIKKNIEYEQERKELDDKKSQQKQIHAQITQLEKESEASHKDLYELKNQYIEITDVRTFYEKIQQNEQYYFLGLKIAEILMNLDLNRTKNHQLSEEIDAKETHLNRKKYYDIENMQKAIREYQIQIKKWRTLYE